MEMSALKERNGFSESIQWRRPTLSEESAGFLKGSHCKWSGFREARPVALFFLLGIACDRGAFPVKVKALLCALNIIMSASCYHGDLLNRVWDLLVWVTGDGSRFTLSTSRSSLLHLPLPSTVSIFLGYSEMWWQGGVEFHIQENFRKPICLSAFVLL